MSQLTLFADPPAKAGPPPAAQRVLETRLGGTLGPDELALARTHWARYHATRRTLTAAELAEYEAYEGRWLRRLQRGSFAGTLHCAVLRSWLRERGQGDRMVESTAAAS